jgi:hypothetical protein
LSFVVCRLSFVVCRLSFVRLRVFLEFAEFAGRAIVV